MRALFILSLIMLSVGCGASALDQARTTVAIADTARNATAADLSARGVETPETERAMGTLEHAIGAARQAIEAWNVGEQRLWLDMVGRVLRGLHLLADAVEAAGVALPAPLEWAVDWCKQIMAALPGGPPETGSGSGPLQGG